MTYLPLFKEDKPHFHTSGGQLAVGFRIYTYLSGTDTPVQVYSDPSGATPYTNPIVLDGRGEPSGQGIYADPSLSYKVVLKTPDDAVVWSMDNVSTAGSGGGSPLTPTVVEVRGMANTYGRQSWSVKDYGPDWKTIGNQGPLITMPLTKDKATIVTFSLLVMHSKMENPGSFISEVHVRMADVSDNTVFSEISVPILVSYTSDNLASHMVEITLMGIPSKSGDYVVQATVYRQLSGETTIYVEGTQTGFVRKMEF